MCYTSIHWWVTYTLTFQKMSHRENNEWVIRELKEQMDLKGAYELVSKHEEKYHNKMKNFISTNQKRFQDQQKVLSRNSKIETPKKMLEEKRIGFKILCSEFYVVLKFVGSLIFGIGRFQTLFQKSVKFWNFDKMFGAFYFSSKITPTARICAAYTLRGRRYSQKHS